MSEDKEIKVKKPAEGTGDPGMFRGKTTSGCDGDQ